MKNYTNEAIIKKVVELWGTYPTIIENKTDYIKFEVGKTSLNIKQLFALCKFFDTEKISEEAETREGGYCSTCWYEYTVLVFTIRPTPEEENERLYDRV